jgi:hypothetical protein
MPVHDWTRVRANRFHDFHQSWTVALCNALNAIRLPPCFFAMIERKEGEPEPDFITLDLTSPTGLPPGGIAVVSHRSVQDQLHRASQSPPSADWTRQGVILACE